MASPVDLVLKRRIPKVTKKTENEIIPIYCSTNPYI